MRRDAEEFVLLLNDNDLLVYSPTSLSFLKEKNYKTHMIDCRIFNRDVMAIETFCRRCKRYRRVVSFGGGTANDTAKYMASVIGNKFISIPTMLSTNSFATNKVALAVNGEKTTLDAKLADQIILDTSFIRGAKVQNLYGIADIFSIYTALYDWDIASRDGREVINYDIYSQAKSILNTSIDLVLNSEDLNSDDFLLQAYDLIGLAGHITNVYGCGRPESGSEHIMAKALEQEMSIHHGCSVSIGIICMGLLQGSLDDKIIAAIRRIRTLDSLIELGVQPEFIKRVLLELHPRSDRYSIIDITKVAPERAEDIVAELFKIAEDKNGFSV